MMFGTIKANEVKLMTENGFAPPPPLVVPYLVENFKLRLLRDVCILYAGVLVSDSLLYMLQYPI